MVLTLLELIFHGMKNKSEKKKYSPAVVIQAGYQNEF
jgi:hypothetical protein